MSRFLVFAIEITLSNKPDIGIRHFYRSVIPMKFTHSGLIEEINRE
ncbi:MAG: hypothetical protein GKR97_20255 [Rhizobiaceae bacterium]|nr:hypothetical protein [Rhizobiaceae bacterium]